MCCHCPDIAKCDLLMIAKFLSKYHVHKFGNRRINGLLDDSVLQPASLAWHRHSNLLSCSSCCTHDLATGGAIHPSIWVYRKRHQPTPHYAWLWTLVQAVNQTSGRSGSASEDDPAERGCSRSRTTLGSTPTTPGGSHMEGATTRGRSSVPLTD